ncbi:hypothetical protein GSI_05531 [Ganoderma sinense ZZ0214-1]|uniref:Uncharacterized protein n=1 Tax=Ganoderma sinense ZZ0214-1 TaxID=1077348 RepID=A0A2G8SET0_9APHY|nr:hypothetical protein GSI_05527 [Ganoderma sinense ZZ0214-1]PIL32286.1 hypothetical protein GSI_05531 [Ganoderma sinense ZZ0214-1]
MTKSRQPLVALCPLQDDFVSFHPITSELRSLRLVRSEQCQKVDHQAATSAAYDPSGPLAPKQSQEWQMQYFWRLSVEQVEVDTGAPADNRGDLSTGASVSAGQKTSFGYAGLGRVIDVPWFKCTKKISSPIAYPIQRYSGPGGMAGLKARLIEFEEVGYIKTSVSGRTMIDRKTSADTVPNYLMLPHVMKNFAG